MIGLEPLRWVLTVLFGGTSLFHLLRCLRPLLTREPIGETWFAETLHLLMGLSMTAMIWPASQVVSTAVWVVVFAATTGWFAAQAVRSVNRRTASVLFATSMAAMAWMGSSMPAQASATAGHTMVMAGMTAGTGRLGPAGAISGVFGGCLVAAAFWWFARGLRLGRLHAAADTGTGPLGWSSLCHGLMSIGMGLALLTMI